MSSYSAVWCRPIVPCGVSLQCHIVSTYSAVLCRLIVRVVSTCISVQCMCLLCHPIVPYLSAYYSAVLCHPMVPYNVGKWFRMVLAYIAILCRSILCRPMVSAYRSMLYLDYGLEWFIRIEPEWLTVKPRGGAEWFNCQPRGDYSNKPQTGHSLVLCTQTPCSYPWYNFPTVV